MWGFLFLLALVGLAGSLRVAAFSWRIVDHRFLYLSRSQRLFMGLVRTAGSIAMLALTLYFFIVRPICGVAP